MCTTVTVPNCPLILTVLVPMFVAGSGGLLAHWSWKRKWIVLKDQKLYYYKTSFDAVAGGVIHLDGAEIALAPEIKKPL